jgi:hypothetical protein
VEFVFEKGISVVEEALDINSIREFLNLDRSQTAAQMHAVVMNFQFSKISSFMRNQISSLVHYIRFFPILI